MEIVGSKIGHVRVESLLGRGGGGEVYRGYDEVLQRPVAVKVIRGEHQLSPLARARFLREARLLSKLDDPHICRIYDMVEGQGCDYLILEFIEGRTLTDAMKESLSTETKLKFAEQIAGVLDLAHTEHVIHRDLKPDNVMISDSNEVKVLDFGLARTLKEDHEETPTPLPDGRVRTPPPQQDSTETMLGSVLGTLRFMSPEQARGETLTEASDLYSFGILLQELMTGKSAYAEDLEDIALYHRVFEGETLPVQGCDPDLAQLIQQLKDFEPRKRPSAREATQRIRLSRERPLLERQKRKKILYSAAVAVLLILTALSTWKFTQQRSLLPPGQEGRIVVLPFVNQTGQASLDWVGIGLMDMVAQTLDTNSQIESIPTDSVLKLVKTMKLQGITDLNPQMVHRICSALGTRFVVTASLRNLKDAYGIEYTLYDLYGLKSSDSISGGDPVTLAGRLSVFLNRRLSSDSSIIDIKDEYSDSNIANQAYAIGVERLNTVGSKVAEHYFMVCLDLDPKFLWAEFQLASCKERQSDWDGSETILQQLLQSAREQKDRKLEGECLKGIGVMYQHRDNINKAEDYWKQALIIMREVHNRQGEAKIYNNLALVAYRRNDLKQAKALYQQSLDLKRTIGDRQGEAFSLNNLAVIVHEEGDLKTEEQLYRECLAISREIGDREAEALSLGNLGVLYSDLKKLSDAEAADSQSLAINRGLGDQEGIAIDSYNLAQVLVDEGKLQQAEPLIQTAHNWYKDNALMMKLLAAYAYKKGNVAEALVTMKKAKAIDDDWSSKDEEQLKAYEHALH